MASIFSKIHSKAEQAGIAPRTDESKKWFLRRLRTLSTPPPKVLKDSALNIRKKPLIGRMFMFTYDPKGKETLPFYDSFPLILMVGPAENGFYGLNLHYLPPRGRAIFFDKLMEFLNNKKLDETTRFRLSYGLLSGSRKYRAFAPCFKHYLYSQVTSNTVEVPPNEWEIALFLPTDNFIGEKNSKIWAENRKLL
jgi:hypothetical protein